MISVFEFSFYFRQAVCVVSNVGKQHAFLQADLEAVSKKSSHFPEALKSVNEKLASVKAGVSKHRAAARCRSVMKLLPGRAEPRSNLSKSD